MAALLPIGVALVAVAVALLWYWHRKQAAIVDQIQGPVYLPLFGNGLDLRAHPDDFFAQLAGSCAIYDRPMRMCRVWLGLKPYVLVYGAREAEDVFTNQSMINKSAEYRFLHPWMGLGLLTAPGPLWRPRRKLLTPTFHYDILKDFLHVFNAQSRVLCANLARHVDTGVDFDIYRDITMCALDIICETAMGRSIDAQSSGADGAHADYIQALYDITKIVHMRQKRPWLWPDLLHQCIGDGRKETAALAILHKFTNQVIAERREEIAHCEGGVAELKETKGRLAFLDMLLQLEADGKIGADDIRPEVDTFMMEGHDTTAAGLNWALHLLGNYPLCQQKCHEELQEVFGDSDRDASADDLGRLKYLECCVKEALRLFPPVPVFTRETTAAVSIGGKAVPAGTTVGVVPYMVHRDPAQWPDPLHYDPTRFYKQNAAGRHPYAFVPFSAGSRNCIGQRFALMEEKSVLSWILRKYRVEAVHKPYEVRSKAELILRATNGTWLRLHSRHTSQPAA